MHPWLATHALIWWRLAQQDTCLEDTCDIEMDFKFHKKGWASTSEERLLCPLLYEDHLFSFWKDAFTSSALLQPKRHCPAARRPPGPVLPGGASSAGSARPPALLALCAPAGPQLEASGHPRRTPQSQGRTLEGPRCFSDLSTTFASITKRSISQDAPEPKLHTQIIVQKYLHNYRSFRWLLRPPRESRP